MKGKTDSIDHGLARPRSAQLIASALFVLGACASGGSSVPAERAAAQPSTVGATSVPGPARSERPAQRIPQRNGHVTKLLRRGPSPQDPEPWQSSGDLEVVHYESNGQQLGAYLRRPKNDALRTAAGSPVLLYLHGGFALGAGDVDDCSAFTRAGFAVLAPAWRGENGNPGSFELAYGELDDARAALDAIKRFAGLDPARVVVFGHSAGGMLSALMALYRELPVLDTGSAGGFYPDEIFESLPVPFEDTPDERRMRLAYHHAAEFANPHFACAGQDDAWPVEVARRAAESGKPGGAQITVQVVPGDHHTSLAACMTAYLARVRARLDRAAH